METTNSKLNLFQKIQKIRVELQEMDLKKSGINKYAGFKYYELADFLPELNKLCDKYGVCNCISFTDEIATLTIYDCESETTLQFTSPMRELELKGCNKIQGLGGVETYSRRYLYLTAYEIVEDDFSDAIAGQEQKPKHKPKADFKPSDSELVSRLENLLTEAQIEAVCKKYKVGYLWQLNNKILEYLIAKKEQAILAEAETC